jgi:REP element-mobilizing transposase RayT
MNTEKRKGEFEKCVSLLIWSPPKTRKCARMCDIRHRIRAAGLRKDTRQYRRSNSREAGKEYNPRRKPWVGQRKAIEPQRRNKIRRASHPSGNVVLHMIFSAQPSPRRVGGLDQDRHPRRSILVPRGIVREMPGAALIINATADHVHLLLRIRPAHSPAEIARVVRQTHRPMGAQKWDSKFAWQSGGGLFSVSESSVAARHKIHCAQEAHHRKHSFQEEYIAFPHEEQHRIGREVHPGLVSFAPPGFGCRVRAGPRLAPWAAFLCRFAAGWRPD